MHTKGPWEVSQGRTDGPLEIYGVGTTLLASVHSWQSDARLIAEAPAMLQALTKLVDAVDPDGTAERENLEPYFQDAVIEARFLLDRVSKS